MKLLVTGGCGFIGSAVVRGAIAAGWTVINVDRLTYAATGGVGEAAESGRYVVEQADVQDAATIDELFRKHSPDAVMHLAAESHVDRSIEDPSAFVMTNVVGTFVMLEAALTHFEGLDQERRRSFRFHHVSTDEVFGSLGDEGVFDLESPYRPRSPYSATKAGSDHLVRAWHHTYGLPTIVSSCSNNYGPFQFPEKLIPVLVIRALRGESLPVYGTGENVRDWLFVEDHAEALLSIVSAGVPGETYLVGGGEERSTLEVAGAVCDLLDELSPRRSGSHRDAIELVVDRPGHDHRYAMDHSATTERLGWSPTVSFEDGLRRTVEWYLANEAWWGPLVAEGAEGTGPDDG